MRSSLLVASSVLAILGAASASFAQTDGGSVRVGASVSASTDSDGRDYRIELQAGQGIEITLRSDDVDPYVAIYAANDTDTALAEDDDGMGSDLNSRLRFVPSETGTYVIRASAFEAGDVTLGVARWTPPTIRSSPISVGRSDSGRLTDRSPVDDSNNVFQQYRIGLAEGERIELKVESTDIDPLVRIGRDQAVFQELAANDDGAGSGLNSLLVFTAPEAGNYLIRVTSASGSDTGRYELTVGRAKPLAPAVPVSFDEAISGNLTSSTALGSNGKRADRYSLSAEVGRAYQIDMTSGDLDSYLSIYDDKNVLVTENDDGGSNLNSSITFVPKTSGTYIIEASALGDVEGRYELTVEAVEPPPAPANLAFNQKVEGELTDEDARLTAQKRYDAYRFSATDGQRLLITLGSADFDAVLELGKAGDEFEVLESDDDGAGDGTNSRILFTVPEAGDYVVRAQSFEDDGRGAYELELKDRGPEPKAGSILIGATARGSLGDEDNTVQGMMGGAAFYDDYLLTVEKDDKLRLILVAPNFDALLMVGQGEGDDFTSSKQDDDGLSDTHSRLNWTAPRDGEYVVRVTSYAPNSTGTYSLIVERQP